MIKMKSKINNLMLLSLLLMSFIFISNPINIYNDNCKITQEESNEDVDERQGSKEAALWSFKSIWISDHTSLGNGTWADIGQENWCSGDGTKDNPYIIENVIFNAENNGHCFEIRPTIYSKYISDYFIITNCTFINSGSTESGIRLFNTTNGIIINNTISFCREGINVDWESFNNTFISNTIYNNTMRGIRCYASNNNTFIENNVFNITQIGISLTDTQDNIFKSNNIHHNIFDGININSNSHYNNFTSNIIENNEEIGIQVYGTNNIFFNNYLIKNIDGNAQDNTGNNQWNSSIIGNYWDDYFTSQGGLDADDNGVGDIPYKINNSGSINTVNDSLPIWDDGFNGSAIIINNSASNNWEWAKTRIWCLGSGTWNDPYVIKDIKINAQELGSCITIQNSIEIYFRIENCSLINSSNSDTEGGIKLENSNNGTIINNNCSDNLHQGITLINSKNNTILANNFSNNGYKAIYIQLNSYNNTISKNLAIKNQRGIIIANSDNNSVLGNLLYDCNEYGIGLSYSNYTFVSENIVNDNGRAGSHPGISMSYCHNNTLIGNSAINNTGNGLSIWLCYNNTIIINNASGNSDRGIFISESNNNTFIENEVRCNRWGIKLFDSSFNKILKNFIYNNTDEGISLEGFNTPCERNTFSDNIIKNNSYGINILKANNSLFYKNYFYNNTDQYVGSNCINFWNNSVIGNYWDDYDGHDIDNDGIGDTPYALSGSTNDSLPIWDEHDPIINIILPKSDDKYGKEPPDFEVNIYEPYLDIMWYTFNEGNKKYVFSSTSGTIDSEAWSALDEGKITITFYANDTFKHEASKTVTINKSIEKAAEEVDATGLIIIVIISITALIGTIGVCIFLKKRQ